MAFPAQAQETINICDRTQQVQDEILRHTPTEDECNSVRVSEMANISNPFELENKGITSLNPGDFDEMPKMDWIKLNRNTLTTLPPDIFSGLPALTFLDLHDNHLTTLPDGIFSNLPGLGRVQFHDNRLDALPDNIFLGTPLLQFQGVTAYGNPGAPFKLTVRFDPETLEDDFEVAPVRLVLREGAPRPITVPLLVTGRGGALITGSPDSLTISGGSTQSDTVTIIRGKGYFRLTQGSLRLGGKDDKFPGIDIVRGSPITLGGVPVRVKVFLEGALE